MNNPVLSIDSCKWRIAEAIAWCTRHGSLPDAATAAVKLRTPDLRPSGFTYSIGKHSYACMQPSLGIQELGTLRDTVEEAARLRVRQLKLSNIYPAAPARHLAGGRLLFYDPYENLAEGSEEQETQGYFDVDAVPPWDTWLWLVTGEARLKKRYLGQENWYQWYDRYLISWVPPELIDIVDAGLRTSTTDCLAWADDLDSDFLTQLRETGIVT